ncbi:HOG (high osmolarity glycerol) pathway protein [Knufia peltigerae]|uniref:HOG (High osmolarity glycerol) pathway protein n=1 Tax=Knufia peltigerae TaxID=1002370 RepID=A0AA38XRE4_9EURO|nr:HOG (high osmolarity glycerol) pathway protein [Knufia peltigerae]
MSPPLGAATTSPPALPPLITTTPMLRRASSQRPTSYVERRMSSFSNHSKASHQPQSRPSSHVFPAFHSSLPYTLVRDFAYLSTHPLHYGPPPNQSGLSTPVSESRRLSDPAVSTWEDGRGHWSATPPWMSETPPSSWNRDRLPALAFKDDGPPYSEDDDIQSPIVTTSRHKKHKSNDRGRSPGDAGPHRGYLVDPTLPDEVDGPGEAVDTYDNNVLRFPGQPQPPQHRDSNFAKPLQRKQSPIRLQEPMSEDDFSEAEDDTRFSKDYSFTIASPDEEMHGKAVALFDFESEHQNELPLKEGQIILVSYRHGQGWLVAEDPRTGESGLVPEEFVRLVRDIEGGLHGLNSVTLDDTEDVTSPVSTDPSAMNTPVPNNHNFPTEKAADKSTNGGSAGAKHPPIQSNFSTSSRDFSPYPLPGKNEESTPTQATKPKHEEIPDTS